MAKVIMSAEGFVQIERLAEATTRKITREVERDANRRAPVDTGDMRKSIHSVVVKRTGRVFVGTDHWAPTEYGSRPHIIESGGAYSLHNHETGQYFGRRVKHPGTPSQPFMRPALYKHRGLK